MAGKLVPSDSTQAMASLMSAYGDVEADDDAVLDTSGVSAHPQAEATSSPDTRTEPPGAHFISDDEEPHHSPRHASPDKPEQNTTSSESRPVGATNKCEFAFLVCNFSLNHNCKVINNNRHNSPRKWAGACTSREELC